MKNYKISTLHSFLLLLFIFPGLLFSADLTKIQDTEQPQKSFSKELYPVIIDGKWTFINYEGEPIFEKGFDDLFFLEKKTGYEGVSLFWGIIEENVYSITINRVQQIGRIPKGYTFSEPATQDIAIIKRNDEDKDSKPTVENDMRMFSFSSNAFIGESFSDIRYCHPYASFCRAIGKEEVSNKKWREQYDYGYITFNQGYQEFIAPKEYILFYVFPGGLFKGFRENASGRVAVICDKTNVLFEVTGDKEIRIEPVCSEDILLAKFYKDAENKQVGFLSKEGIVIAKGFEHARAFSEGKAQVVVRNAKGESWHGFVNTDGKFVVPTQYKNASKFVNGIAFVVDKSDEIWAINSKGKKNTKIEIGKKAEHCLRIDLFHHGVCLYEDEEDFGVVNLQGKIIWSINRKETEEYDHYRTRMLEKVFYKSERYY